MDQAVFEIKQNAVGYYYFVYRAANDATRLCSHSFADRAALERCVADMREIVPHAAVEETVTPMQTLPRFLLSQNDQGFQFTLEGLEGERIFTSDPSHDRETCLARIQLLKATIRQAHVLDSSWRME